MVLPQNRSPLWWQRYNDGVENNCVFDHYWHLVIQKMLVTDIYFLFQPASSENGSGVKKLGALVDYNDSDSDEGKLSCKVATF